MIYVFDEVKNEKSVKGKEALAINKIEAPSSVISSSSLSTSESSSRSYATSNTSELAQPKVNAWKTVSPPKNGSVWDKNSTTPKASEEVQSHFPAHQRPRSIVDIIVAVEKAKGDQTTQWRQTAEHNTGYSNGISSIVDAYDGPYLNSQRLSKYNSVTRPSSSSYSSSQRSSSNPDTVTASQSLPPLPPPPRPNASKQEHHRYFYALRKATRMRKQMMNASNSPPQEIKRRDYQLSSSESSTSSSGGGAGVDVGPESQHSRFRRYSESSNTDIKLPFMQRVSNNKTPNVINPHTSQSTLFPVPCTHDRIPTHQYQEDFHSPSYIAMKAWQNTSLASKPKLSYDPQFMLDILDSDDKETQKLFLDLDATMRLQHAELGF